MLAIWTCGQCQCFTCGAKGIPGRINSDERYCNKICQYPPCRDCGKERLQDRKNTEKQKPGWRCPQCIKQQQKRRVEGFGLAPYVL